MCFFPLKLICIHSSLLLMVVSGEVEAEKNDEDNVKAIQIEMSSPPLLAPPDS